MNRELFLRIMNGVESYDDYFVQKWNAANVAGLSCFQKVTAAFCMLTHGVPTDAADEYVMEFQPMQQMSMFALEKVQYLRAHGGLWLQ